MKHSTSRTVALISLTGSVMAFFYAVLVGTDTTTGSVLVLGAIPLLGLVGAVAAVRSRSTYLTLANILMAFFGIPAAIAAVYLRSGV